MPAPHQRMRRADLTSVQGGPQMKTCISDAYVHGVSARQAKFWNDMRLSGSGAVSEIWLH